MTTRMMTRSRLRRKRIRQAAEDNRTVLWILMNLCNVCIPELCTTMLANLEDFRKRKRPASWFSFNPSDAAFIDSLPRLFLPYINMRLVCDCLREQKKAQDDARKRILARAHHEGFFVECFLKGYRPQRANEIPPYIWSSKLFLTAIARSTPFTFFELGVVPSGPDASTDCDGAQFLTTRAVPGTVKLWTLHLGQIICALHRMCEAELLGFFDAWSARMRTREEFYLHTGFDRNGCSFLRTLIIALPMNRFTLPVFLSTLRAVNASTCYLIQSPQRNCCIDEKWLVDVVKTFPQYTKSTDVVAELIELYHGTFPALCGRTNLRCLSVPDTMGRSSAVLWSVLHMCKTFAPEAFSDTGRPIEYYVARFDGSLFLRDDVMLDERAGAAEGFLDAVLDWWPAAKAKYADNVRFFYNAYGTFVQGKGYVLDRKRGKQRVIRHASERIRNHVELATWALLSTGSNYPYIGQTAKMKHAKSFALLRARFDRWDLIKDAPDDLRKDKAVVLRAISIRVRDALAWCSDALLQDADVVASALRAKPAQTMQTLVSRVPKVFTSARFMQRVLARLRFDYDILAKDALVDVYEALRPYPAIYNDRKVLRAALQLFRERGWNFLQFVGYVYRHMNARMKASLQEMAYVIIP